MTPLGWTIDVEIKCIPPAQGCESSAMKVKESMWVAAFIAPMSRKPCSKGMALLDLKGSLHRQGQDQNRLNGRRAIVLSEELCSV